MLNLGDYEEDGDGHDQESEDAAIPAKRQKIVERGNLMDFEEGI
jgi:hypothetical protein